MLPGEATSAVENRRVGVGLPRAKEKRRTTGGLEDKGVTGGEEEERGSGKEEGWDDEGGSGEWISMGADPCLK